MELQNSSKADAQDFGFATPIAEQFCTSYRFLHLRSEKTHG